MATFSASDGSPVHLGPVLARAGEGTIYDVVGRDDLVAKVFHTDLTGLPAKRAKIAAMTAAVPPGAVQPDGFVVLTWPQATISDDDGTTGYLMRRIDARNAVEIHMVSNPADRMNPLPSAPQWTPHVTWRHLVTVAANLCLAAQTAHEVDAVIGDFQERNILVDDATRVTLVDCDSMQFTDTHGQQFLCAVGRPEFTAPELVGIDLSTTARKKPSDLFALAVHIHLLLMAGNHPFLRGQWTGPGDQPDAISLAKSGWWAGGPGSPLLTHPLAPPPSFLPESIQRLFVRAFTDGARTPTARPTAAEWRAALQDLTIRTCARGHQIPEETLNCPWCHIDDERAQRKNQRPQSVQTVYPISAPHVTAVPPAPAGAPAPAGSPRRGIVIGVGAAAAIAIASVTLLFVTVGKSPTPVAQQTFSPGTSSTPAPPTVSTQVSEHSVAQPNTGLAGTWIGEYRNTGRSAIELTVTDADRLNGTIVYRGESPCTESWRETGRSMGSIYVSESRISGNPSDCWDARWELIITGDTITGTMTQHGQGFGASIFLRKQS